MKLIIEASVSFSLLLGSKRTKEVLESEFIELYAPKYLFEELEEHKREIKEFSKLSADELKELFIKLKSKIKVIPREKFAIFLSKANELISDKDDTEYLALALLMNLPIWSNDLHFKEQLIVKVFTTEELLQHLRSL